MMQLTETQLPDLNVHFDVTITHIVEPDCLYIQRVPPSSLDPGLSQDPDPTLAMAEVNLERLEEMAIKINQPAYFKNLQPLSTAWEGKRIKTETLFIKACPHFYRTQT